MLRSILGRSLDAPEINVAIFAFLLNLTWEFAQVPLFAGMPSAEHWQAILVCGRATLGDVVIALGLSPLLQWVVLPPIVVWFVRRQLT